MEKAKPYLIKEKETLLQLIKQHPVLLSRKIDGVNLKKKQIAWERIENIYNSQTVTPRSVQQLKKCWDKVKRSAKKARTQEGRELVLKVEPEESVIYVASCGVEPSDIGFHDDAKHISIGSTEEPNQFDRDGIYSQVNQENTDAENTDRDAQYLHKSAHLPSMFSHQSTQTELLNNKVHSQSTQQNYRVNDVLDDDLEEQQLIKLKYQKIMKYMEEEQEMKRVEHKMKMKILKIQFKNAMDKK